MKQPSDLSKTYSTSPPPGFETVSYVQPQHSSTVSPIPPPGFNNFKNNAQYAFANSSKISPEISLKSFAQETPSLQENLRFSFCEEIQLEQPSKLNCEDHWESKNIKVRNF